MKYLKEMEEEKLFSVDLVFYYRLKIFSFLYILYILFGGVCIDCSYLPLQNQRLYIILAEHDFYYKNNDSKMLCNFQI